MILCSVQVSGGFLKIPVTRSQYIGSTTLGSSLGYKPFKD